MKFAVVIVGLVFTLQAQAFTNFTVYKCQSSATGLQLEAIPEFGEIAIANAAGETIKQIDSTTARVEALSATGAKKISFVHEEGDTVLVVVENGANITAEYNGDSSFVCSK